MSANTSTYWGQSDRRDSYSLRMVDPFTLEDCGGLDFDPEACSITWDAAGDNFAQASISIAGDGLARVGYDRLMRVVHRCEAGGVVVDDVLGTFFVDRAPRSVGRGLDSCTADCYSTLYRMTQDVLADDLSRPKGTKVASIISDVVTEVGGVLSVGLRATEGDVGASGQIFFPLGTNRAECLRSLAGFIGCRIGVDPWGRVTLERALGSSEIAPSYEFEAGANCVCLPGRTDDEGIDEPINRVVAYWSRTAEDESDGLGVTGRCVVDLDPGDRYSYERCGRRRTYVLKLSQAYTAKELENQARAYLADHSGSTRYVEIEHVRVPGLNAGDVVIYRGGPNDPANMTCQIEQMSVSALGKGCMTKSKMRVIGEAMR